MTVVHLITGLQLGGAENQLQRLVLASDGSRFRHVVVSMREAGEIAQELRASGTEVHCLDMARAYPSVSAWRRLVRLLRSTRPDVLHCWMYHACLMGVLAARSARVPRVIWSLRAAHADLRDYSRGTRTVVSVCAKLSGIPDAQIVNSEAGRTVHQQLGYASARMKVVPNGIDATRFSPDPAARTSLRDELGVAADTVLVGMFSRFDPMKDHVTFLRAASFVHRQHPEVRFVLAGVGTGVANTALAELIHEHQVEDAVFLLGPRRDIPRLNAALDIACLSSWTESFPNVVVEAMSCAVPCVVTKAGDSASVVGETGRVVPVRDSAALASGIEELLSMPPSERTALGWKARERVLARFTVEQAVSKYEALYAPSSPTEPALSQSSTVRSGAV
jgi:glycosyltransferase involved in cell wall biosynthesis